MPPNNRDAGYLWDMLQGKYGEKAIIIQLRRT
jgi:hypothetical protein